MNELEQTQIHASVHGKRWNFPSQLVPETSISRITAEEEAIQDSLKILLASISVERFIKPKSGLDMHNIIFMPMGSVTKALLKDHIKYSILFNESRISLLSIELDTVSEHDGKLTIVLDYIVRSTNSRKSLVFPFYRKDRGNVSATVEFSKS